MNITNTYNHLKTLSLTTSQRHFSIEFLSMSPSYLSMICATERQPSTNTLVRLSKHLSTIAKNVDDQLAEHLFGMSREVLDEALK